MKINLNNLKFLFLSATLVTVISCSRSTESDHSRVSLSLPDQVKTVNKASQSVSAQDLSQIGTLRHAIVQVSGSGFNTIWLEADAREQKNMNGGNIELTIPKGDGRLIQILAVYQNDTDLGYHAFYGDIEVGLSKTFEVLDMSVVQQSPEPFFLGRVMGKYVTDAQGNGPTGSLDVSFKPLNGRPELLIEKSSIWNGWFNIIAASRVPFAYRINGQEFQLGAVASKSSLSLKFNDFESKAMAEVRNQYVDKTYHCKGGGDCTQATSEAVAPQAYLRSFFRAPGVAFSPSDLSFCAANSDESAYSFKTHPAYGDIYEASNTCLSTAANDCGSSETWDPFAVGFSGQSIAHKVTRSTISADSPCAAGNPFVRLSGQTYKWPIAYKKYLNGSDDESGGFSGPLQRQSISESSDIHPISGFIYVDDTNNSQGYVKALLLPDLWDKISSASLYVSYDEQSDQHGQFSCSSLLSGSKPGFASISSANVNAVDGTISLPVPSNISPKAVVLCFKNTDGNFMSMGYYTETHDSQGGGGQLEPTHYNVYARINRPQADQCHEVRLVLYNITSGVDYYNVSNSSNRVFTVSSSGSNIGVHENADCSDGAQTNLTIASGQSEKIFYYKAIGAGSTETVTLTNGSLASTGNNFQIVSVSAAVEDYVTQLGFGTANEYLYDTSDCRNLRLYFYSSSGSTLESKFAAGLGTASTRYVSFTVPTELELHEGYGCSGTLIPNAGSAIAHTERTAGVYHRYYKEVSIRLTTNSVSNAVLGVTALSNSNPYWDGAGGGSITINPL